MTSSVEKSSKTYQNGLTSGSGIVEQINSYRMGSESTNVTSRTTAGKVNNIHTTPNVTKNPKFSLNLAFSNNSKCGGNSYFGTFD